MANERDPEEFALSGAYSPQQGAGLPPAVQGGLPLGASPPVPPRAVPPPSFQRAPLMQLGGQAPDLNQMIAERLQRIQGFNPMGKNTAQAEDAYAYALHELPKLQGLAGIRSQDRALQQQTYKELTGELDKFHKDYSPDQQRLIMPFLKQNLSQRAKMAGMDLSDETLTQALTSRDVAGTYSAMFNDPVWQKDQQRVLAELGQAKSTDDTEKVLTRWRGQKDAEALAMVQQTLPQVVGSLGGTREKPLDMQAFLTNPQVKEALGKSPTLQRVFNAYVANKENEKFLANIGLSSGENALKALEGPKMTETAQELLAAMYTGPNGKPLTPALATSQQIGAAVKASQDQRLTEAIRKGEGAAAIAMSLPAAAEERDQHVDVATLIQSGQITKPPAGITVGELRKGNYRFARPEQQKALMALQPQRTAFGDMNAIADKLIKAETWTDAVAQGIRLHAGARTGADPIARAYQDSTAAATSYLARMVESGVMTDADVARWQSAATSSFFDTKQAQGVKRALMADIIDAAQASVVSQVAGVPVKQPTALRTKLAELDRMTTETWKNTRAGIQPGEMLITDGQGQYAKMKKGAKLTAPWKEVK